MNSLKESSGKICIKKMAVENRIYEMLKTQSQAEKAKALLTLELLNTTPAGIGDHSTGDFYISAGICCGSSP